MNQKDKINNNFFSRAYLAITDFRWYPFVQREKFSTAILFFLKLVVLASMIIALFFTLKFIVATDFVVENYNKVVPEFSLSDGVMQAQDSVSYEMDNTLITINTEKTNAELRELYDVTNYSAIVFVAKDAMETISEGISTVIDFSELGSFDVDKTSFYNDVILKMKSPLFKILMYLFTFSVVFTIYLINKIFNFILLLLVVQMLGGFFNLKLSGRHSARVVAYVLTLPIIVEVVIWGIKGYLPDYASLAYHLLSFVYCFYAIRALKLDLLIIGSPEGMAQIKKVEEIMKINEEIEKANEEERKRILEEDEKEKEEDEKE